MPHQSHATVVLLTSDSQYCFTKRVRFQPKTFRIIHHITPLGTTHWMIWHLQGRRGGCCGERKAVWQATAGGRLGFILLHGYLGEDRWLRFNTNHHWPSRQNKHKKKIFCDEIARVNAWTSLAAGFDTWLNRYSPLPKSQCFINIWIFGGAVFSKVGPMLHPRWLLQTPLWPVVILRYLTSFAGSQGHALQIAGCQSRHF